MTEPCKPTQAGRHCSWCGKLLPGETIIIHPECYATKRRCMANPGGPPQTMREHAIYMAVARHMANYHEGIIYRFDLASDMKLTQGQARRHKLLHPRRGYPDLFIAHYAIIDDAAGNPIRYHGQYLEIKNDDEKLMTQDGRYRTPHIAEQAAFLHDLQRAGYWAQFVVGLSETIETIDEYLNEGGTPCAENNLSF